MTVTHYGEEVEIIDGDGEEGWVAIEGDERDTIVAISELRADDKTMEVFGKLLDMDGDLNYVEHLPLHVNEQGHEVTIKTNNGEILFEENLLSVVQNTADDDDVARTYEEVLNWVNMAHEQPKRLLFKKQDNLLVNA